MREIFDFLSVLGTVPVSHDVLYVQCAGLSLKR
jgi:hypothetical protein